MKAWVRLLVFTVIQQAWYSPIGKSIGVRQRYEERRTGKSLSATRCSRHKSQGFKLDPDEK
jgi:hypothetical protein